MSRRLNPFRRRPDPTPADDPPRPAELAEQQHEAERRHALAVLRRCREGGCLELAEGLINAPLEDVDAAIDRASEIRAACRAAGVESLAQRFIRSDMPLDDIRHQLADVAAAVDDSVRINPHNDGGKPS